MELVGIQRTLHGIDDDIHLIAGILLGHPVAFSDSPTLSLLHVGGSPGRVELMDSHDAVLYVDTRSESLCRTEQYTYLSLVGLLDKRLLHLVAAGFLNEAHLLRRHTHVDELVLDLAIDTPCVLALPCTQVAEHQLHTLHGIEGIVVALQQHGALCRLVAGMVAIHGVNLPHV